MKTFSNIIIIAALLILPSASARQAKKTTPRSTVSPIRMEIPALPPQDEAYHKGVAALPAKTYKQLRDDIKILKADQVINQNDLLTDYFVIFVKDNAKKSNLADVFTQALLQAGTNLYAQFSEDNQKATQQLSAIKQQIANIISQLKKPAPQESKKITPLSTAPTKAAPHTTKQEKKQPESVTAPQNKQAQGIVALGNFRKQTAIKPMTDFYANAQVNEQWLTKGLQLVLNGAPLSAQNKMQIQGELVGNATELMREFLHKNTINSELRKMILDNVEQQVISFMNNQPLQGQTKPQQSLPKPKAPSQEPPLPQPKKPTSEPATKPVEQKKETNLKLPAWISAKDNTFIIKEFDIELLAYIFKNQDAAEQDIIKHFAQQIPQQLLNKDSIIKNIQTAVNNTFKESEPEIPVQQPSEPKKPTQNPKISKKKWPIWISEENDSLLTHTFKDEVLGYLAKHIDADNKTIAEHFSRLLPESLFNKKIIEKQIEATIDVILPKN